MDERLARLAELAEGLPNQGDGIVGLVCKAPAGAAQALIAAEPDRLYPPAYLHHRGWIGLRLDAGEIEWERVEGLLVESYLLTAPKRLAARVTERER